MELIFTVWCGSDGQWPGRYDWISPSVFAILFKSYTAITTPHHSAFGIARSRPGFQPVVGVMVDTDDQCRFYLKMTVI